MMVLPLLLCTAGCASGPAELQLTGPAREQNAVRGMGHWWQKAGDPVLATVIETGLARDPTLNCEAHALRLAADRARGHRGRIDVRIGRIFGGNGAEAAEARHLAALYRYADHRAARAAEIAAVYIEVRRLQEVLSLREPLQAQYADNAEIAGFRREAGLVSGIDTGLAGSLFGITEKGLQSSRARLEEARRALSNLTGVEDARLIELLGDEGRVPDIAIDAGGMEESDLAERPDLLALRHRLSAKLVGEGGGPLSADIDGQADDPAVGSFREQAQANYRDAWTKAHADVERVRSAANAVAARQVDLSKSVLVARRTAEDARLAYRNGTETFATLFVAEAALLAVEEEQVTARADLAVATIQSWRARGGGWSAADIGGNMPTPGDGEVIACE